MTARVPKRVSRGGVGVETLTCGESSIFGELMIFLVERVVVRRLDPRGRIAIPADWRAEWKSDRVVLTWRKGKVEVSSIKPVDLTSLFDSISVSDRVDFTDPHSLRKALFSRRKVMTR